ncbi:nucleotide exchange factor GrpE [Arthrobacter sp. UM1]|uniref:nucleotide exchange factor GrpE n=1 Tax=Arthrobacter sp. UM1 TaxID=2766776 RepID=UPI001CF65EFA|nr:nucleotide exchange factor GrpE [Arthrobacter sp. UM1]MCB4208439.1 nucleotide exchange factor GrpE [Arthrobacter sp. UM1]
MPHHGNEAEHNDPVNPDAAGSAEESASGEATGQSGQEGAGQAGAPGQGQAPDGDALSQAEEIINAAEKGEDVNPDEAQAPSSDEAAELRNDLLRLQAEYVNYRRRVERDRAVAGENATIAAISSLLPVLDDIEAARQHGDLEGGPFAAIATKLYSALKGLGLEVIDETGVPFDPNVHETLMQQPSAEVPEDHVAQVLRNGYRKGERVLRAAQVIVSTGE